jgi:hypothetical protein
MNIGNEKQKSIVSYWNNLTWQKIVLAIAWVIFIVVLVGVSFL